MNQGKLEKAQQILADANAASSVAYDELMIAKHKYECLESKAKIALQNLSSIEAELAAAHASA